MCILVLSIKFHRFLDQNQYYLSHFKTPIHENFKGIANPGTETKVLLSVAIAT